MGIPNIPSRGRYSYEHDYEDGGSSYNGYRDNVQSDSNRYVGS